MEINPVIKEKILGQLNFRGKVISDSMEPVIKVGDEIVVEVKSQNLKRFDIIVFEDEGRLICHFIWNINLILEPKLIQTRSIKGTLDVPITKENYIGKVISHKLSFWQKLKILLFN